jgi:TPR repeat protein
LLSELSKENDLRAETYLGVIYYTGYGVDTDRALAEKWFARAAKQHGPEAEYDMGTLYSVTEDHVHDFLKAAELLRSSAQAGYVPSMYSLGLLLVNHPEVSQKHGEAIAMLEAAAEAGSWRSSLILGVLARDGKYTPRNTADACRWFMIATRQGGPDAERLLTADSAVCAKTLDLSSQKEENQQANAWLAQHSHADLFVFGDKYQAKVFPVAEVPVLGLADMNGTKEQQIDKK